MKDILILLAFISTFPMVGFAIPDCKTIDLRSAPLGTKCMTSKNAIFERVSRNGLGEAWMGPDNVIWGDRIHTAKVWGYSHYDAEVVCKDLNAELPSYYEDVLNGYRNGFLEVLPNLDRMVYWTSDVEGIQNPERAIEFRGGGDAGYTWRRIIYNVRCVIK